MCTSVYLLICCIIIHADDCLCISEVKVIYVGRDRKLVARKFQLSPRLLDQYLQVVIELSFSRKLRTYKSVLPYEPHLNLPHILENRWQNVEQLLIS